MLGDWEECDQLAARVAAHVLDLAPELSDDLLRWAKSGDPWRRRLTLATAAAMNRQGRARPELATALAFLLIGEEERIVRKAVPWGPARGLPPRCRRCHGLSAPPQGPPAPDRAARRGEEAKRGTKSAITR